MKALLPILDKAVANYMHLIIVTKVIWLELIHIHIQCQRYKADPACQFSVFPFFGI